MKTFLTAAILGLTGLAGAAGAQAQDVHKFRGGSEPRHETRVQTRHEPRREDHGGFRAFFGFARREPAPRIETTWVAPRYEAVFAGYDSCGKPVYTTVCVSAGYWATRPVRCD
jgi:hypothetical protein